MDTKKNGFSLFLEFLTNPSPKTDLKLALTPTLTLNTKNGCILAIFGLDFGLSNPNLEPNPKTNPKTNPNPNLNPKLGLATPWPPHGDIYKAF